MSDVKKETLAGSVTESDREVVDADRRRALTRLGLTAAIAYAAPALLPLTPASADSDSSGGGSSGHDGGSSGHDGSSDGSSSHDGSSDGSGSDDHGSDDSGSGSSAPLPPSGNSN